MSLCDYYELPILQDWSICLVWVGNSFIHTNTRAGGVKWRSSWLVCNFYHELTSLMTSKFFATKSFSFFTKKLRFVGIFCYYTVNSSIFVIKKIVTCFSISQNWKREKKKRKPCLGLSMQDMGRPFPQPLYKCKGEFSPLACYVKTPWNVITFLWCVVHKNDHGSWTLYDVSTKKMHEGNSEERWKPTKFHNQNTAT
jgi:hypothetical protein